MALTRLLREAADLTGRSFPTEEAAGRSLTAFRTVLRAESAAAASASTPVESLMKRLFGRATVRRVAPADGASAGEALFRVFLDDAPGRFDDSIAPLVRALRAGDLDTVARVLRVEPALIGSPAFRARYLAYVRDAFPDARLAERLAAAGDCPAVRRLSESTRSLRPQSLRQLAAAVRGDAELDRLVGRLAEHVRLNGGKRFAARAGTFFKLAGVAGTGAAVVAALHEQAKRSAGCWRVYLDPVTRRLRACKILHASCRHRQLNDGAACDRTPVSFAADMCRGVDGECARCDPSADPSSALHLPSDQFLEPDDLYVCRPVASVGEVLGAFAADIPELAQDAVSDFAGVLGRVWDAVKYFLLVAVCLVAAVLSVYFANGRFGRSRPESDGDGDEETRSLLSSEEKKGREHKLQFRKEKMY